MFERKSDRILKFLDHEARILVVRVIGNMSGKDAGRELFDIYTGVPEFWTWSKIVDLRRYSGQLDTADIAGFARRWAELTQGHTTQTRQAIVTLDPLERARVPEVSPLFPNILSCHFNDYHDALAWVRSGFHLAAASSAA